jgi:hypothetical protein
MSSNSPQEQVPSVSQLTNYEDALSTQSSYKTCLDTIPSSSRTSTVSRIILEPSQDSDQRHGQGQEFQPNTTGPSQTQPTQLYQDMSTQQLMDQFIEPSYSPLCSQDINVYNNEELPPQREPLVFPNDDSLHVPIHSQPIVPQNTPNLSQD